VVEEAWISGYIGLERCWNKGKPVNQLKASYFDSQAHAEWAAPDYSPDQIRKIEYLIAEADIHSGQRIVEPGCGTGRLTEILADSVGSDGLVMALDISPKMIEACRRRLAARRNVKIQCAAVEEFSFPKEAFDMVICHNVFPHFDDKRAAVNILSSALKPAGKFMIFHFLNSSDINDLHRKAHPSLFNDLMPDASEMETLFQMAGFKIDFLLDDDQGYFLSATVNKSHPGP
jgi:2-polyprenyl-3-methyl-5-hydroxy-6-metoxy-1,4-benzoquinol methylase